MKNSIRTIMIVAMAAALLPVIALGSESAPDRGPGRRKNKKNQTESQTQTTPEAVPEAAKEPKLPPPAEKFSVDLTLSRSGYDNHPGAQERSTSFGVSAYGKHGGGVLEAGASPGPNDRLNSANITTRIRFPINARDRVRITLDPIGAQMSPETVRTYFVSPGVELRRKNSTTEIRANPFARYYETWHYAWNPDGRLHSIDFIHTERLAHQLSIILAGEAGLVSNMRQNYSYSGVSVPTQKGVGSLKRIEGRVRKDFGKERNFWVQAAAVYQNTNVKLRSGSNRSQGYTQGKLTVGFSIH